MLKLDMDEFERGVRAQWASIKPPPGHENDPAVLMQIRAVDLHVAMAKFVMVELERTDVNPVDILKTLAGITAQTIANFSTMVTPGQHDESSPESQMEVARMFLGYMSRAMAAATVIVATGKSGSTSDGMHLMATAKFTRREVGDA